MAPDACVKNGRRAAAGSALAALAMLLAVLLVAGVWLMGRGSLRPPAAVRPAPPPSVSRDVYPSAYPFQPIRPMRYIPAGEFTMGSGSGNADEQPAHRVALSGFWMDEYEVTFAEFMQFSREHRATNGLQAREAHVPVTEVSWDDAAAYCAWRCRQERVPEGTYRLPTEAEWEYAARGGLEQQSYPWGSLGPNAFDIPQANYGCTDNNDKPADGFARLAPVGSYRPNGFGLFDMAGNVWEWCCDWYSEGGYTLSSNVMINPAGAETGIRRVWRGGGWGSAPESLRCAARGGLSQGHWMDNLGFRCVRVE